jgi:predicted acetyltransferase
MRVLGAARARHKDQIDTERSLVRVASGKIVATLCAYVLDICLPGGVVAQATAVIDVGVLAEWRGSGYFRELMTTFLFAAHARHEPLALLNTDELTLYPRFGFAPATHSQRVEVGANATAHHSEASSRSVEVISDLEAASLLPDLFAGVAASRLGEVSRTPSWWREYFDDAEKSAVPSEFAVSVHDGEIDGYVALQLPDRPMLEAALIVAELVGSNEAATTALIAHCLGRAGGLPVRFRSCAVDSDIARGLMSTEVVTLAESKPQLWLRLIDIDRALSLRRYVGPARLVFEVSDELAIWNTGRHELQVDADGVATVARTTESAMIRLGPIELASTFLGGTSFRALAAAGQVIELMPGSILTADQVFATAYAPFCSTLL